MPLLVARGGACGSTLLLASLTPIRVRRYLMLLPLGWICRILKRARSEALRLFRHSADFDNHGSDLHIGLRFAYHHGLTSRHGWRAGRWNQGDLLSIRKRKITVRVNSVVRERFQVETASVQRLYS